MSRPANSPFRYTQRKGEVLPKLTISVDMVPFPSGSTPASISIRDGNIIVGSLELRDLEKALAEWKGNFE